MPIKDNIKTTLFITTGDNPISSKATPIFKLINDNINIIANIHINTIKNIISFFLIVLRQGYSHRL